MKKLFIYISTLGVAVVVICWLCQKGKNNHTTSKTINKKVEKESFDSTPKEEAIYHKSDFMEEMCKVKNERSQDIYERHLEAGKLLNESYRNIMEEFVEDFSVDESVNEEKEVNDENNISDSESISPAKEMDLISKELDDILE